MRAALLGVLAVLALVQAAPAVAAGDPSFVRAFGADSTPTCTTSCVAGSAGGGAGQLMNPAGVAVSGSGDVYVADSSNQRVAEFTQAGGFVRAFDKDVGGSGVDVCTSSCVAGSVGNGAGQLNTHR